MLFFQRINGRLVKNFMMWNIYIFSASPIQMLRWNFTKTNSWERCFWLIYRIITATAHIINDFSAAHSVKAARRPTEVAVVGSCAEFSRRQHVVITSVGPHSLELQGCRPLAGEYSHEALVSGNNEKQLQVVHYWWIYLLTDALRQRGHRNYNLHGKHGFVWYGWL